MSSLFDDLKEGLEEAIDYEKGKSEAKARTYMIMPIREYSKREIREIRKKAGMTQNVFASYMGVSKKGGRTHPTGPAFRLMNILDKESFTETDFVVIK